MRLCVLLWSVYSGLSPCWLVGWEHPFKSDSEIFIFQCDGLSRLSNKTLGHFQSSLLTCCHCCWWRLWQSHPTGTRSQEGRPASRQVQMAGPGPLTTRSHSPRLSLHQSCPPALLLLIERRGWCLWAPPGGEIPPLPSQSCPRKVAHGIWAQRDSRAPLPPPQVPLTPDSRLDHCPGWLMRCLPSLLRSGDPTLTVSEVVLPCGLTKQNKIIQHWVISPGLDYLTLSMVTFFIDLNCVRILDFCQFCRPV